MKYTLLQLTQDILYSMDADEITSINDTYESVQVTHILRSTYYDIVNRAGLPRIKALFEVTQSGDTTKPILMTIPDTVKTIDWIKYDNQTLVHTAKAYREASFLTLHEFLNESYLLDAAATNVGTMTLTTSLGTHDILYRTDRFPDRYTTIDTTTLIFNALDVSVDTFLKTDKTVGFGTTIPVFTMGDTFVPQLNDEQFQLLLQEAKSLAWAEMKQASNAKAEQSAKRNWILQQKHKEVIDNRAALSKIPGYGRK